jgi:hypothetical protein
VFNHSVLTTGYDNPKINHIILARPTNSLSLLYQKIGRGTRVSEGKDKCFVEDFCGNINRFGFIEHLTIEDLPGYGWGVFSGDNILTGYPLDRPKVTRQELLSKEEDKDVIWFGKHKGTPIKRLSYSYMEYMIDWINTLSNPSPNLITLQNKMIGLRKN